MGDSPILIVALVVVVLIVLGVMWYKRKSGNVVKGVQGSDPCIGGDGSRICKNSPGIIISPNEMILQFSCEGERFPPENLTNNYAITSDFGKKWHLGWEALFPDSSNSLEYPTSEAAIRDYCRPVNVARHNTYWDSRPNG